MLTILFDEAEARGEINGVIKLYRDEMDLAPGDILRKIMNRFGLKKEEAEGYIEKVFSEKT